MQIVELIKSIFFTYVNYIKKLSRVARIDTCDKSFVILFDIVKANNYNKYINRSDDDIRNYYIIIRFYKWRR